ncbi:hypothetical protein C8F04DRAFT_1253373 [Mycena alexandri]|uniref:Uncharacterized protein n=1 Tax=Mycena alexandri TaxID=1745969 RepID=A0AAD6T8L0_9AGAR|nr:hypothetical protein C8F04DRAFT_1253373 [Mycena alexandri]
MSKLAHKQPDFGFWFDIACLWVGTLFYGIYLVLFCICIYILLHRPRNAANGILLGTAILLFALSTIQAVLNLLLGSIEILHLGDKFPADSIGSADDMLYVANNIVADSLLIYRCWVVWNRNIFVTIPGLTGLVILIVFSADQQIPLSAYYAMTLATNVVLSVLTAGRIWWIGRQSRLAQTSKSSAQSPYASTISIILESGIIYSVFVVVRIAVDDLQPENVVFFVTEMLRQIVGIVPTLIIVRVGLGMSVESSSSTASGTAGAGARSGTGQWQVGVPTLDSETSFTSQPSRHVLGVMRSQQGDVEKGINADAKLGPEDRSYDYGVARPQGGSF